MRPRKYTVALLIAAMFFAYSCKEKPNTECVEYQNLLKELRNGDLLFRRGTGVEGHIVVSLDKEGNYSHVGIVVKRDSNFYIVHAVPNEPDFKGDTDRVKCEEPGKFLDRYTHAAVGLYRPLLSDSLKAIATAHALRLSDKRTPFDHDYDSNDSTKLYCTELIEYVYGFVGVTFSEGRRTDISLPGFDGEYIMPSDITTSDKLELIVAYEN